MTIDHNFAAAYKTFGIQAQSGLAAGTGDNTEVTSLSTGIDTKPYGSPGFNSGSVVVPYKVTLGAAETLKITLKISDSVDGVTWASDTTLASAVTVATGVLTAINGTYEYVLDLAAYKQFLRFKITMDLSAGATDTFVYGAALVLGGADRMPA